MKALIAILSASLYFNGAYATEPEPMHHDRQMMIHKHSSMVMPFEMDKVTHYFVKTKNGGILRVTAKDSANNQVALIQQHLLHEQQLFSEAKFDDPKKLHGMGMPGLAKLENSKGEFTAKYEDLKHGAQIKFVSQNAGVVEALHEWFDAQIKDHGKDARDQF